LLSLQLLTNNHQNAFLNAVAQSRDLHYPWVSPASNPNQFAAHLKKYESTRDISLVALTQQDELVGCINLNEIVRGIFQSAYLGYYAFTPFAGRGMMRHALDLAIDYAFNDLGLHRLEANIQPGNARSKHLVSSLGFRQEGFSPRYLNIGGSWKDHERFALTVEDRKRRTA
jgi:ribosomal-protein-alanine N-acetyltransferase